MASAFAKVSSTASKALGVALVSVAAPRPFRELEVSTTAKALATAAERLPWLWSLPGCQERQWEPEVFCMAKAFTNVSALALKHLPRPWASPQPQGPQWELEVCSVVRPSMMS